MIPKVTARCEPTPKDVFQNVSKKRNGQKSSECVRENLHELKGTTPLMQMQHVQHEIRFSYFSLCK